MNTLSTSVGGLLVVESPAKASTISRYLGDGFQVLASYGHIRDLIEKDGAVDPENNFAMQWEIPPLSKKRLKEIADALKNTDMLYLATDPDREGEAIAWHLHDALDNAGKLKNKQVKRVVFHEVTPNAVKAAIQNPRTLDDHLIDAYRARRGLDYLVGFRLSPVLWRKMPGSKSAGRVQSVALRLVCEREAEIEAFNPQEYWQITGEFHTSDQQSFTGKLHQLDGEKLDKYALGDQTSAQAALQQCVGKDYTITEQNSREEARRPSPPFNTSALQQEASRRLYFSTSQTMQLAQKLYEGIGSMGGLITYMRTDGISMSSEAISSMRGLIAQQYGADYLPDKPRLYKNKSKNAQEAHEAIRPTDPTRTPDSLRGKIDEGLWKLYQLIWQRAVASQMTDAKVQRVSLDITSCDQCAVFRATGQALLFPGYQRVYGQPKAGKDNDKEENKEGDSAMLPPTHKGDHLGLAACTPSQHFTQPPPRYSEASLVKKMEELGIGRPSTYASTLKVLQDRGYVVLDQRRFVPEDRGRLVTTFLSGYFARYVDYDFTAGLESRLDAISNGDSDWLSVMHDFWRDFSLAIAEASELTITEVRDYVDEHLGAHFFRAEGKTEQELRVCPSCADGRLQLGFGRYGLFIGCSNYPQCRYVRQPGNEADGVDMQEYPQVLGDDPHTKMPVLLNKGPYGFYVQLGHTPEKIKGKKAEKPKRAGLLKGMDPATVTLDVALSLLALPRHVGAHPDTGEEIKAGFGRYGAYLLMGGKFTTLPAADNVLDIGLNRAVAVLAEKAKGGKKAASGRELGQHPQDDKPITVKAGRYGPYVQHGKVNATIPKDIDPETITLEAALPLLAARVAKMEEKGGKPTKAVSKGKKNTKAKRTK